MKYEVQTRFGDNWENVWHDDTTTLHTISSNLSLENLVNFILVRGIFVVL